MKAEAAPQPRAALEGKRSDSQKRGAPISTEQNSAQARRRERRRHPRKKVAVPVEVHLEGDTATIRTLATNLNLGGCFLKMTFSFELGTKLELMLALPTANVNAIGVVVSRFRNLGNGIRFSTISQDQMPKLEQFLGAGPTKTHTKSL